MSLIFQYLLDVFSDQDYALISYLLDFWRLQNVAMSLDWSDILFRGSSVIRLGYTGNWIMQIYVLNCPYLKIYFICQYTQKNTISAQLYYFLTINKQKYIITYFNSIIIIIV